MSTPSKNCNPAAEVEPAAPALQAFPNLQWKLASLAVAAAVVVFLLSAGLYWFILREHETRRVAIEVSDCLAAVIAGILVFRLLQYERDRRRQLRQRLEVISEMNHHVRNALQVISLSAYSYADQQQLATVKESVERIQWALKEILPKL
ncbi:MAG: hypothetical protein LAO06_15725 [Acidobacteriia bacterium]|nr:hypothetical protein [Terriglobia bacterium]